MTLFSLPFSLEVTVYKGKVADYGWKFSIYPVCGLSTQYPQVDAVSFRLVNAKTLIQQDLIAIACLTHSCLNRLKASQL